MAKILSGTTISSAVPKMLETADAFIINGQVHDKITLEPTKLQTVFADTTHCETFMNTSAIVDEVSRAEMYTDNNVIIDKYEPEYSYTMTCERNGDVKFLKTRTLNGTIEKIFHIKRNFDGGKVSIYTQDVNFLYGYLTLNTANTYFFKASKITGAFSICQIGAEYSRVTIIKDTPLFIYYTYTRANDRFAIGKYNKSANSKTDIYTDDGTNVTTYYTMSKPMIVNENEILSLRCNITFNSANVNKLILKRYLIDYRFDKIYAKEIDIDCSMLPRGILFRRNDSVNWNECTMFNYNDNNYFTLWNRGERKLYLFKKMSDNHYSIIQEYELSHNYNGAVPYNDGKTLMFYTGTFIDFMSFRQHEERFELASTSAGDFVSLCVDRNKIIWLQHRDSTVEMIGLNVPTIAEALFTDMELNYINQDIETTIEVFAKNFDGNLVSTNVEVILNGPIRFSDTNSNKKIIKTSANTAIRIPVRISNSGYVEANAIIL